MGVLFDGYEAARQKQEALLAERRRKEEDVDQHLRALTDILEQDKDFMQQHGLSHDVSHHTLRVLRNQSPVIAVHYESDAKTFRVKSMSDDSNVAPATAEESARAIGEMVFRLVTPRG